MRSLIKILGTVAVINVLARLFGFAREVVIGYQYGTSYQADSIVVAFTIPNFIYIVLGGAVTTAFISVYSKLDESRKKEFVQTIFSGLTLVIGGITILFMLFSDFWIELFFSGMSEKAFQLTSELFVWMAPSTFFLVLAMWLSGLMNVEGRYRLSAFSTLLFNGLFLLIGVGLTPFLLEYSYGLGASVGALAMVLLLILAQKKTNIFKLHFNWRNNPDITRFMKLAVPILFGGAALQFYFFIQRIYAADLQDGLIASLNYASKMTQFPQAVLMTTITTVIFPMLAKTVGEGDTDKLKRIYQKGFKWLSVLLIPATVYVFFYAKEIIEVVFQYGNFNEDSTAMTYPLLQVFALSMFTLAMNTYVTRFFYAMENSYIPILFNIVSVFGINILVINLFLDELGATAIALGTVVGSLVNTILLIIGAQIKYRYTILSKIDFVKVTGFLLVTGTMIWAIHLLPVESSLLLLLLGGLLTAAVVLGGLRVFRT